MAKQKTEQVDKLLDELQDTVRHTLPTSKPSPTHPLESKQQAKQERIDQFNKLEEGSAQALDKLNKMEV